jgi:hypothetical protein
MSQLALTWVSKDVHGRWLGLHTVDLTPMRAGGVYMIWHGGSPGRVVRVGQGDIASRLTAHRSDRDIQAYNRLGLFVTWAAVDARYRDGVERYLADTWHPLVGGAFPSAAPIAVNSPW